MAENREYKSDVFSMLMEDKENALAVYNALNGSSYEDPEQVEMCRLEKSISLSIRNDAAFIIDMNVSIYEHQSSYNPNMPLRSLLYVVDIFKGFFERKDLFGSRLITLPAPKFAVFYNGPRSRPSKEDLKLSSAYSHTDERPQLELICTVYNINPGQNEMLQCKVLDEYTSFIETVRRYENGKEEHPVEKAIEECIQNHILEKFLKERGTEVINAMTIDMTFEAREKIFRAEERAEGRAEAIVQIYKKCIDRGMSKEEAASISGITEELLASVAVSDAVLKNASKENAIH